MDIAYRVVNEGISGNTSKDGVLRTPEMYWRLHPAVVIVAFGGNDGLRGLPIRETEMNLSTIIAAMQDANAKVILGGITLPPNYGSDYIATVQRNLRKGVGRIPCPTTALHVEGCVWCARLHAARRHPSDCARLSAGCQEFRTFAIAPAARICAHACGASSALTQHSHRLRQRSCNATTNRKQLALTGKNLDERRT